MKKSESENKNKVSENSKSNDAVSVSVSGKKKKKIRKKRITAGRIVLIIILLIIAAIAAIIFVPPLRSAVFGALMKNQISSASEGYRYYTVERHDITTTLTGTGTLQPYDSYTVTATVTGDILSADFEEMDKVQKDDVLYVIDSSDIEDDIEEKRKDGPRLPGGRSMKTFFTFLFNDLERKYDNFEIKTASLSASPFQYCSNGDFLLF